MSISLNQLNKPGMKASFGKGTAGKTSVTSQATKNMANYSGAGSSSIFKLNSKHVSNWVPGQQVTPNVNKHNYQAARMSLNSRVFVPSSSYGYSGVQAQTTQVSSSLNSYGKGQIIGQLVSGTFGMLNKLGVFDGIKGTSSSQSASQQLGEAISQGAGSSIMSSISSSEAAGAISSMESCNDSASLRGAIGNAEAQLRTMQGQTNNLKSKADAAEKSLSGLETAAKNKEKGVSEAKQSLTTAKNTVTAKTNIRDTKKLALEKADANFAAKSEALTQAKANTESAQAALDSANAMPDQVPDGKGGMKPNEAKQQAVAKAQEQLNQARNAEKAAAAARDEAKKDSNVAKETLENAEKELKEAEEGLKDAEAKQKEAEENLKKAEQELEKAKKDVADAKGAIETFKKHEQDVKVLTSQIKKQEARLKKMEDDEIKDYTKYNDKAQTNLNKANNLAGKIVGEVDTRSERRASKGIDKANDKAADAMSRRNALSDNVRLTNLLKKDGTTVVGSDNNEYRAVKDEGQTYYSRNGQLISAEELPEDIKTQFGAQ